MLVKYIHTGTATITCVNIESTNRSYLIQHLINPARGLAVLYGWDSGEDLDVVISCWLLIPMNQLRITDWNLGVFRQEIQDYERAINAYELTNNF